MKTKKITISLPEKVIKEAKKFCDEKGYSLSGLIRLGLEDRIKGKSDDLESYMTKLEEIRSDRDTGLKQIEIQALQQQEMMKAYIDSMKSGNQPDPLATMMLMKMMENQEESTSESVMEGLTQVANTIEPSLIEVLKQRQQQVTESGRPVDPLSELTPSEREWSDTMSDMYIRKKKKKLKKQKGKK